MDPNFVHLRLHTEYSIRDSLVRIPELMKEAARLQLPAVAITDHMNLFGLVKFYKAALEVGVKPITGVDLRLYNPVSGTVTTATAFCKNITGYHNLTRLISRAYLEGQGPKEPTVLWEWLVEAKEGLILLSGNRQGDIGQALIANQYEVAEQHLNRWLNYFADHFYLDISRTGREQEEYYLHAVVELAKQFRVPLVATNDVRFLKSEDFEAHEARVCIYQGRVLGDTTRSREYSDQQYLRTPSEMSEVFSDLPEALQNSVEIAKRCNLELRLGESFLPRFPLPAGASLGAYLTAKSEKGLVQHFERVQVSDEEKKQSYYNRLRTEIDVINKMGFSGYFLIVSDFIQWAKDQGIPVGPGRGSGAGSLVAFVLGITELDPLEHDLLFERFLNPERISMPDFDIDFCMERRDEVIHYVANRYGRDCVAQIITYGTMAARAVVRDVGRVLSYPYGYVDKIAKLIPFELGITLEKALVEEEQLLERYEKEEEIKNLIDLAAKLEGLTRNAGKHAGGVVIAPTVLTDFVPLYCEAGDIQTVTQFDKDDVEAVGLVKFDFLGLRTLTIIDWAVQAINKGRRAQGEPLLDIARLHLGDKKTFDLLKSCETTAIFQLESRGMRDLIRRIQPDSFEDITALVALFRPGPLQSGMVDDFIDRKHGRAKVFYPHKDLETILKHTYGVILYQEQVMQIAQVLAGYTLGGADLLRRAMGKKKPEEMAKQRAIFNEGDIKGGIDGHLANQIFDLMEKFAGYGFNKSHSAAYALLAYQTAWLKAHYPAEFMAAVLSSDMDKTDKVMRFIEDCKRIKVKILSPNINVGYYHFTVNAHGEIEYGLGAIKGVGKAILEKLITERDAHGTFESLFDLVSRADSGKVNRKALEALIEGGALDEWKISRASLSASIEAAIRFSDQASQNQAYGQTDLFGMMREPTDNKPIDYTLCPPWTEEERLRRERLVLGFYFSGHPMYYYHQELKQVVTAPVIELSKHVGKKVVVAGLVMELKRLTTKRGQRMALLTIEDTTSRMDITIFNELYEQVRDILSKDSIVLAKGELKKDDFTGGYRLIAEAIRTIDQVRERLAKRLVIQAEDQAVHEQYLNDLSKILTEYGSGNCPVIIQYRNETARAELSLGQQWRVKITNDLLNKINQLSGKLIAEVEYTSR